MYRSKGQGSENQQEEDADKNNEVDPAGLPKGVFHIDIFRRSEKQKIRR